MVKNVRNSKRIDMMQYKLVVTDMDGTLLNSEKKISSENLKAIKRLKEKGIKFAIATGRLDTMIKSYLKEIENDSPVICCNGALIRNILKDEFYYANDIQNKDCLKVSEICDKYNAPFVLYGEHTVYSNSVNFKIKSLYDYNSKVCEEDKVKINIASNIFDEFNHKERIFKILIISDDNKIFEKIKNEINGIEGLVAYKSDVNFLDVMHSGVDKGDALNKLSQIMNIKKEEIIAIGDNHNDVGMLKNAGYSIAMENGENVAKDAADYITCSNDEDGVAKALNLLSIEGGE